MAKEMVSVETGAQRGAVALVVMTGLALGLLVVVARVTGPRRNPGRRRRRRVA